MCSQAHNPAWLHKTVGVQSNKHHLDIGSCGVSEHTMSLVTPEAHAPLKEEGSAMLKHDYHSHPIAEPTMMASSMGQICHVSDRPPADMLQLLCMTCMPHSIGATNVFLILLMGL